MSSQSRQIDCVICPRQNDTNKITERDRTVVMVSHT